MSKHWQHKILHYEVPPPATSWEKIAAELDDMMQTKALGARLGQAEASPPPAAWTSIAASLDELFPVNQFPVTLYDMEATPPPAAWEKIQSALDEEVITATRKRKIVPLARYAAAAAILGAMAFGAIRLFTHSQTEGSTAKAETVEAAQKEKDSVIQEITADTAPAVPAETSTEEARNDAALEASKKTFASLDASDRKRIRKVNEDFLSAPADPILVAADFNPVHAYESLDCSDVATPSFAGANPSIDMAGRYAMLITPDGHIIRVSKKLGELVCCVSGEEQDEKCVDQLKKWRQKIANSPVTPAPGNFMDILDLLHTLKDSSL